MATNTSSSNHSGGIGFFGLLAIVFITLKLTHYIDWTWLWVLSPIWLPLGVVFGIFAAIAIFALLAVGVSALLTH